jgi:hypothetical protein
MFRRPAMQQQRLPRDPDREAPRAVARPRDEPLSDEALIALLGGAYLGGLAAFLAAAYGISLLF